MQERLSAKGTRFVRARLHGIEFFRRVVGDRCAKAAIFRSWAVASGGLLLETGACQGQLAAHAQLHEVAPDAAFDLGVGRVLNIAAVTANVAFACSAQLRGDLAGKFEVAGGGASYECCQRRGEDCDKGLGSHLLAPVLWNMKRAYSANACVTIGPIAALRQGATAITLAIGLAIALAITFVANYFMVGIANCAPSLTPEGQRVVTVLVRV